jgi:hypothetical protein
MDLDKYSHLSDIINPKDLIKMGHDETSRESGFT